MTQEEQLRVMRAQLSHFATMLEKVAYMHLAFDPDPEFTQEARDIMRGELCRQEKRSDD